jgi:hypothetical protein
MYLSSSTWESSINDATALGWMGYQGFCDDSAIALVIKKHDEGVSKIIKYCVSVFMDDPLGQWFTTFIGWRHIFESKYMFK